MSYIHLQVECIDTDVPEILEAELMDFGFESFELKDSFLNGYAKRNELNEEGVDRVLAEYESSIVNHRIAPVKDENWNSVWESNYPSVTLDKELFIGAPFHDIPSGIKHVMIIEPNMSFGTGHHPTTALVLRHLFKLDISDRRVLDFGTGSGILSIYSDFRGGYGHAIEIDENAAKAAQSNLKRNNCSNFTVVTGGIEKLQESQFDIILANINLNVIEECLPMFIKNLKPGGQLICSGFLVSDIKSLTQTLRNNYLEVLTENALGEWGMIAAKRPL